MNASARQPLIVKHAQDVDLAAGALTRLGYVIETARDLHLEPRTTDRLKQADMVEGVLSAAVALLRELHGELDAIHSRMMSDAL